MTITQAHSGENSADSNAPFAFNYRECFNPKLIEFARTQLQPQGVLMKQIGDAYWYLKIQDDFIHALFPLLEEKNIQKPNYFTVKNPTGAHISVIYPGEEPSQNPIAEVEQAFSFEITRLLKAKIFNKQYYVLLVHSESLKKLRKEYGLSEQLNFRGLWVPLHITIAIENAAII